MKTKPIIWGSLALGLLAGQAAAEGQLNIYNWGNYIAPDLVTKFEAEHDVKVTVTEYDSSDTALAKIQAGGHGFDIWIGSSAYVPIYVQEGLLAESLPNQMENFAHLAPKWVDVEFDPGRSYTIPWLWGTVGITVNTDMYKGEINTAALLFDTPDELKGKVNVVPEMRDVMGLAIYYLGGTDLCTDDKELLVKVRDLLVKAKENWISMDYSTLEQMVNGDYAATMDWNGPAMRARLQNPAIHYGYAATGYPTWMDNAAILADAQNAENARLFMNFMMDPENAAILSNFTRYANGVAGSEPFMDPEMLDAPEIKVPAEFAENTYFARTCSPEIEKIYSRIWTDVKK
ncbi:extracellular solute-binding protein [uncultured Paracoccus sp.]|uniref:extracellular solute-binding protein n=1 Tax=uncultured Paracoccus sp. TaxID=189685 RepID=UPI0026144E2E|nr:extracellular solute-binding protein [uncultured Paracoccus sp.]